MENGIHFDWTFSLGTVIQLLGFVGAAMATVYALRGRMDLLAYRLARLEETDIKQTEELIAIGKRDARFEALEKQVDELKHGKGYIR